MGTKIIYQDTNQEVQLSKDNVAVITARELERSALLPEHPTANGFINDSVILNPRRVVIEGQISNVNDYFDSEESTADSYRLEYEALFEALLTSEELVVIQAHNRQYSNMRLESFNVSDTIDGFRFTSTFKEMFFGTSKKVKSTTQSAQKKKVSANNPKKQATSNTSATTNKNTSATTNKTNAGTGTTVKNPQAIERKKSVLFQGKEFFKNLLGG